MPKVKKNRNVSKKNRKLEDEIAIFKNNEPLFQNYICDLIQNYLKNNIDYIQNNMDYIINIIQYIKKYFPESPLINHIEVIINVLSVFSTTKENYGIE